MIAVNCKYCNKEFKVLPGVLRSGVGKFCSHSCAMRSKPQPSLEDRFWDKVKKLSENGCWIFTGCVSKDGYGCFHVGQNKRAGAHRVSYELNVGEIPFGMNVCHKCDNPSCVNPNHLFIGTQQDNIKDMISKGRAKSPPIHMGRKRKIDKEQVAQILSIKKWGFGDKTKIASSFGVRREIIARILKSNKNKP